MTLPVALDFKHYAHVGVSVEKPQIPDFVRKVAAEHGLTEKDKVHISVVVTKNARLLWEAVAAKENPEAFVHSIKSLFESYLWEYSLTDEYFLHERTYTRDDLRDNGYSDEIPGHTRRTIVQKVELPDLSEFYEKLNDMFGISLPAPVPHITLFAWSDYESFKIRGIGINSEEEFKRFTKEAVR
ncbi:MAG: hypothetical protein AAB605_03890 [Patescibacteria group bacterium]